MPMREIAIKVERVYKQYRLGMVSTGTVAHDLNRWWHKVLGKEDPYLSLSDTNDRTGKGKSEYVWALNDINFEVKQGDVLGIIGKNGAGKSTLLKLLSKVTTPTKGSIKINGRIASLLEVGTGFHPELTGRENIFLNGAILGMTKSEIRSKFDEIVDFSGVERYIDTPVKRYSSGMYVRLAFAVAAHLEPEILIIDEVLAVGDADFQKKCLGKMKDVSGEGRTVLFVSHNIQAISNLCNTGVMLVNGMLDYSGNIEECIKRYMMSSRSTQLGSLALEDRLKRTNGAIVFTDIVPASSIKDSWTFRIDEEVNINFTVQSKEDMENGFSFFLALKHPFTNEIITNFKTIVSSRRIKEGEKIDFTLSIPPFVLRVGQFQMYFALSNTESKIFYDVIDENINLPMLSIDPVNMDVHLNSGYVSIPATLKQEGNLR